jgi:cytochrome c oxidase subunit 2
MAPQVDALFAFLMAVTAFFSLLIALLIVVLVVKYHHKTAADRQGAPDSHLLLELTWTGIPLGIAMIVFVWGAHVFYRMQVIPPDAIEIRVVGKQWMWKIQHPGGQREINDLHVPLGRPIALTMISEDVIHNFSIPAFRMKKDVLPGRYTRQWFEATKTGEYHLFCDQYCGTQHGGMIGRVVVMEPKDYETWLAHWSASPGAMTSSGAELFQRMACASCHLSSGSGRGPSLSGVYGARVPLEDGRTVVADEDYLRESILKPAAKVVRGYQPIMPSYQNQLDEESVNALIAYIKGQHTP